MQKVFIAVTVSWIVFGCAGARLRAPGSVDEHSLDRAGLPSFHYGNLDMSEEGFEKLLARGKQDGVISSYTHSKWHARAEVVGTEYSAIEYLFADARHVDPFVPGGRAIAVILYEYRQPRPLPKIKHAGGDVGLIVRTDDPGAAPRAVHLYAPDQRQPPLVIDQQGRAIAELDQAYLLPRRSASEYYGGVRKEWPVHMLLELYAELPDHDREYSAASYFDALKDSAGDVAAAARARELGWGIFESEGYFERLITQTGQKSAELQRAFATALERATSTSAEWKSKVDLEQSFAALAKALPSAAEKERPKYEAALSSLPEWQEKAALKRAHRAAQVFGFASPAKAADLDKALTAHVQKLLGQDRRATAITALATQGKLSERSTGAVGESRAQAAALARKLALELIPAVDHPKADVPARGDGLLYELLSSPVRDARKWVELAKAEGGAVIPVKLTWTPDTVKVATQTTTARASVGERGMVPNPKLAEALRDDPQLKKLKEESDRLKLVGKPSYPANPTNASEKAAYNVAVMEYNDWAHRENRLNEQIQSRIEAIRERHPEQIEGIVRGTAMLDRYETTITGYVELTAEVGDQKFTEREEVPRTVSVSWEQPAQGVQLLEKQGAGVKGIEASSREEVERKVAARITEAWKGMTEKRIDGWLDGHATWSAEDKAQERRMVEHLLFKPSPEVAAIAE